ncbi:MAG: peroxidase-related enzyme [Thermoplasmata archaeon]
MSWIDVVEPEEASGRLAEVYEEIGRRRGRVANIYKIHSLNPDALRGHLDLYMSLLYRRDGLARAQREMIGVLVSSLNSCRYCVVHHSEALARYEKDSGVLEQLPVDFRRAPISDRDRIMLEYCEKLTTHPDGMKEGDVKALREAGFTDSEILDINLIASYFNFVNRVVLGLGLPLEDEEQRVYRY